MKISLDRSSTTFVKWVVVGGTSLLIEIGGFAISFKFLQSILLANLVAVTLSTTFNYTLHYFWTFKSIDRHGRVVFKYYSSVFFLWILSSFLIQTLTENYFEPVLAKIITLGLMLPLSYIILRFFVYK